MSTAPDRRTFPIRALTATTAIAYTALFVASLVVAAVFAEGAIPQPTTPTPPLLAYLQANPGVTETISLLQFLSAVALAILAVQLNADLRARAVGPAAPGGGVGVVSVGGVGAALLLALSALVAWVMARPELVNDPGAARQLVGLSFVLGGPGHAAFLGLFYGGIALAARSSGALPPWLTASGLVLATAGGLAAFAIVAYSMALFVPLARFFGFLWLIAVAITLARSRTTRPTSPRLGRETGKA